MIAILATIFLPTIERVRALARRSQCLSQLRQTGVALVSFSHDHGDLFPCNVSTTLGGSMEFISRADIIVGGFYLNPRHFEPLSNYMSNARILACPVDRRAERADFGTLQSNSISYFLNGRGQPGESDSIVSGDANLVGMTFLSGFRQRFAWTPERHRTGGNVLFGDAHVEQWNNFATPSVGGRPGDPPGVPGPQPPPNTYPRPGGGYGGYPNPRYGGPTPASPGGPGGGRGVFTQLDEVAKRYASRPPAVTVTATQAVAVSPKQAAPPPPTRVTTNNAPSIVAILTLPVPSADPWPQRFSQHLARTDYWPLFVLILIALALLLAVELLRRHRPRRRKARR